MVNDVVWRLCQTEDFEVQCPSGRAKRTDKFADDDVIMPRRQMILNGMAMDSPERSHRKAPRSA